MNGDLNEELVNTSIWDDTVVQRAGIPIVDVPLVTVGGGIGSFVLVDHLRIAGVPTSNIRVLTNLDNSWDTYEYLTRVSQIPRPERLRSDSSGMPDNLWGFPSYALREARRERDLAPILSVLGEGATNDYWTPRAGTVFEGLEHEARRIGWHSMVQRGQVRMVRRRHGGGYFTILTPPEGATQTKRIAYRSLHVHIAVGYPGLRFLPDLQEYRTKYNDPARVVNAYEPHEFVYEMLKRRPATVLIRGGGIVASRVIQRLMDDREQHGAQTQISHLLRTYVSGPNAKYGRAQRSGADGVAYQGFNWPKGAWGGVLKVAIETREGADRAAIYKQLGGTHTPKRKSWRDQIARAKSQGWYATHQGEVTSVEPTDDEKLRTNIQRANGERTYLDADVIIDCTGLEADLREHRVLADLLDHSGAGRNPMNRLDVSPAFEVRGSGSGAGKLYASGATTLGGYYAGVDSFLGLQYAALQIVDDLSTTGFCSKIGVSRSVSQWWKWMRKEPLP